MCSFYQIPLSKASMKYCGVAILFRGIRVYTRSVMGLPCSDCIRNIVSRPGRLHSEGMYTKLADDYCQGDSPEELLSNWSHLLETPSDCSLCLSATNQHLSCLGFCPKVYSQVVPIVLLHSLAALLPESVKGLTFFVSAYKVLSHVLPYSAVTPIQPTLDCD